MKIDEIIKRLTMDVGSQYEDPRDVAAAKIVRELHRLGLVSDEGVSRVPLSFEALRAANDERAKLWNASGATVPLSFALLELAGEVGEACNFGKKLAREELGLAGGITDTQPLIDELADVVICVDLVARKLGIDLGAAVARKFNETSRKRGFAVMLPEIAPAAGAKEVGL